MSGIAVHIWMTRDSFMGIFIRTPLEISGKGKREGTLLGGWKRNSMLNNAG